MKEVSGWRLDLFLGGFDWYTHRWGKKTQRKVFLIEIKWLWAQFRCDTSVLKLWLKLFCMYNRHADKPDPDACTTVYILSHFHGAFHRYKSFYCNSLCLAAEERLQVSSRVPCLNTAASAFLLYCQNFIPRKCAGNVWRYWTLDLSNSSGLFGR